MYIINSSSIYNSTVLHARSVELIDCVNRQGIVVNVNKYKKTVLHVDTFNQRVLVNTYYL
jgi:hypothetical protein